MRKFWRNATAAPFAAALAQLAILSGLRGIIDPESSQVFAAFEEKGVGVLPIIWAVVYLTGGVFMLYGAGASKTRFEAAGCVLFAGGAAVQAVATATLLGVAFTSVWGVLTLGIFAIAGVIRAKRLMQGERLIWVRGGPTSMLNIAPVALLPVLIGAQIDLSYVLAALGIIGAIGGAAVAFRKARPDSAAVLVDASKDVVLIQKGVIDELTVGLKEAKEKARELERRVNEMSTLEYEVANLRTEVRKLTDENERLRRENVNLRKRVQHLENGNGNGTEQ